jgi:hypothetical protein
VYYRASRESKKRFNELDFLQQAAATGKDQINFLKSLLCPPISTDVFNIILDYHSDINTQATVWWAKQQIPIVVRRSKRQQLICAEREKKYSISNISKLFFS